MLGGGGYALTGSGRWYVTLSKWDAGNGAFTGGLLDQNLPWVSFVKDGSAQFDALFVDSGPSLYQNTTNVQKMEGYEEVVEEGETLLDWGHCHTTYFNPRFFGHHVRVLAIIDSIAAVPATAAVTVLREGGANAGNEVQLLTFLGNYKSGTVTLNHSAATSAPFNPGTQNAYDLQVCLETIPALNGNVFVQSVAPGVYQIEFTNVLRNTNVAALTVNSALVIDLAGRRQIWRRWCFELLVQVCHVKTAMASLVCLIRSSRPIVPPLIFFVSAAQSPDSARRSCETSGWIPHQ